MIANSPPGVAYLTFRDSRDNSVHYAIYRWHVGRELEAVAEILRQAFDPEHIMTPLLADELMKRMISEGIVTKGEVANCWRATHAEHMRQCEREVAEIDRRNRWTHKARQFLRRVARLIFTRRAG